MIIEYQTYNQLYDPVLAEGAIINDRMEGFKEDYLLLHILLRKYNIKSCFEIGTNTGFGTKIIKNAMGKGSFVYSLDLPYENAYMSKQHPISEGKGGVGYECDLPYEQIFGDSTTFSYESFPCRGYYIDAEHTLHNVKMETIGVLKVSPDLIVYHDADMPEVAEGIFRGFDSVGQTRYSLYRVSDTRIMYAVKINI